LSFVLSIFHHTFWFLSRQGREANLPFYSLSLALGGLNIPPFLKKHSIRFLKRGQSLSSAAGGWRLPLLHFWRDDDMVGGMLRVFGALVGGCESFAEVQRRWLSSCSGFLVAKMRWEALRWPLSSRSP
jgi:hypothetical protein